MSRILFVDDEPEVLDGLRRMLDPMPSDWHIDFAASGPEALDLMARDAFDVVVTDMRMPGMDGGELLAEVQQLYPHAVRIVLAEQAEREAIVRSLGPIHQYLTKPCDAETLIATLRSTTGLHELMHDERLTRLVSRLTSIPSVPSLYLELVRECQSPSSSLTSVGEIIAQDPGMTAKILQFVNSAFFGLRRRVIDPVHAVGLLGMETVKTLTLVAHVFSQLDDSPAGQAIEHLLDHSLAVSVLAREIARIERAEPKIVDAAAVAGLLHETGTLVLAHNLPGAYGKALASAGAQGISLAEAEEVVFGANHATVGAYLLGLWGLPDSVVEAVALHDAPSRSRSGSFAALTALHPADRLVDEISGRTGPASFDAAYLERLGFDEPRIDAWREVAIGLNQREAPEV